MGAKRRITTLGGALVAALLLLVGAASADPLVGDEMSVDAQFTGASNVTYTTNNAPFASYVTVDGGNGVGVTVHVASELGDGPLYVDWGDHSGRERIPDSTTGACPHDANTQCRLLTASHTYDASGGPTRRDETEPRFALQIIDCGLPPPHAGECDPILFSMPGRANNYEDILFFVGECSDGQDNDGDGLIDSDDPQCEDSDGWSEESNDPPPCTSCPPLPDFTWDIPPGEPRGTVRFRVTDPDPNTTYRWYFDDPAHVGNDDAEGTTVEWRYDDSSADMYGDWRRQIDLIASGAGAGDVDKRLALPACVKFDVLDLCGDRWADNTVSGNVTVDDGVSVGDGPLVYSSSDDTFRATQPVPVKVGDRALWSTPIEFDGDAATDPVSMLTGLGTVTLPPGAGDLSLFPLLGLQLRLAQSALPIRAYVDKRDGGGLIVSAALDFGAGFPLNPNPDKGRQLKKTSASVGVYAQGDRYRFLGGSFKVGVNLLNAWKLTVEVTPDFPNQDFKFDGIWSAPGFAENPNDDLDSALGGFELGGTVHSTPPFFKDVTFGLKTKIPIPVGETDLWIDRLTGTLSLFPDLWNTAPVVSGYVYGFWGAKTTIGPYQLAVLNLEKTGIKFDAGGSVSIDGGVSVIHKDLISATANLTGSWPPKDVRIQGSLKGTVHLGPLGDGEQVMSVTWIPDHITAIGRAEIHTFGGELGGRIVASEKGLGYSASMSCPWLATKRCEIAAVLPFPVTQWPPIFQVAGADPNKLVTASAAGNASTIEVKPGRPFLLVQASAATGVPQVTVTDPHGHTTSSATSRSANHNAKLHETGLLVRHPVPGRWHVQATTPDTKITAQAIRQVSPVTITRESAGGTKKHRLTPSNTIRLAWTSKNQPKSTHIALYASKTKKALGTLIRTGLPAHGHLHLHVDKLPTGRTYLKLITLHTGQPIDFTPAPHAVWSKKNKKG